MTLKVVDISGKVFGQLTVLKFSHVTETKSRHYYWLCQCSCGEQREVDGGKLRAGLAVSCGCAKSSKMRARALKHGESVGKRQGQSPSVEYIAYNAMKSRCYYPVNKSYCSYGGRGIVICDRWLTGDGIRSGFECFLSDMGRRPAGCSIDRIDVNKNYSPENCRWASALVQSCNRRDSINVDYKGRNAPLRLLCDEMGMNYHSVWQRINRCGWSVDRALTEPFRKRVM